MRAVNLLPRDEQAVRLEGTRVPFLVAVGGIAAVTAAFGVLGFSASGTASDHQAELAAVEASIARLPKAPEPAVSQGVLTQERSDRTIALSAALSSRIAFDRLLREVSLVLPEDAWLTGFKALAPSALAPPAGTSATSPTPGTTAPQGVTIQGATYSHASVARVLSRLSIVPSLENVSLTASALVEPVDVAAAQAPGQQAPVTKPKKKGRRAVVTFTITASLRTRASS
jgi:Tfp pilus assembly protein PilN